MQNSTMMQQSSILQGSTANILPGYPLPHHQQQLNNSTMIPPPVLQQQQQPPQHHHQQRRSNPEDSALHITVR